MQVLPRIELRTVMVNGRKSPGDRAELLEYFLRAHPLVNADITQRLARAARVQAPLLKHIGCFGVFDDPIRNAGI